MNVAPDVSTLNRVRYSALDFDTHFDDLRARVQVEFADDFNDFVLSSLGIMLLDIVAYGLDTLSFYLDRRASDTYLVTARTRNGISLLSNQLGYKIGAATATSVDMLIAIGASQVFDSPIPAGFQFTGPNGLIFQTAQQVVYPAGYGPANFQPVPAYQGVTVTENFVSDGSANQTFQLQRVPASNFIVQGTVVVIVNGVTWTESDFITFNATNQFSVSYGDDPPVLSFGDGTAGNIPNVSAAITVTYVASQGQSGQIAAGYTQWAAVSPLVVNFTNIPLIITNPEASVGGNDLEALSQVQALAGKVFKSRQVAVTLGDYQALAGAFADPLYGRVASAQAISSRSAATDMFLNTTIASINAILGPVKSAVNADVLVETTAFGQMVGYLAALNTALTAIATNDVTANTQLTTAKTTTQAAANWGVSITNEAGDIITQATTGSSALGALAVAFPSLVSGSGTGNDTVLYAAKSAGARGAQVTIQHVVGVTSSTTVAVVGYAITVTLGVTPSATAAQVAAAVFATPAAVALVNVYALGDGAGIAAATPAAPTNLGFTGISGISDTSQQQLQANFDRCSTEASAIQTNVANQNLASVVNNLLAAQTAILANGLDTITAPSFLVTAQTQSNLLTGLLGTSAGPTGLFATAADINTQVSQLDLTGTVAVSVGVDLQAIYDHVDALLSADCSSNLVTVPILTYDAAGFYVSPSRSLIQSLQTYLTARKEVTQTVQVTDGGIYLRRPVIVYRVGVLTGYSLSVTGTAVKAVADSILKGRAFGVALWLSDLSTPVKDNVAGVDFVNVTITGWNDFNGEFQTSEIDVNGNFVILPTEVITEETRPGLPSITINTEVVTA